MVQESSNSVKYKRGQNPKSLANLTPFPKGTNGNPHPGYALKNRLMDALRKPVTEPIDSSPAGDYIVYATIAGAIAREPTPFKEVWDRVEGKVPDPGREQGPVSNTQINIIVSTERARELTERAAERLLGEKGA